MSYHFVRSITEGRKCMKMFSIHGTIRTYSEISGERPSCENTIANVKPFKEIPRIRTIPIIGSAWVYFPIIGKYDKKKMYITDKLKYEEYGIIMREKIGSLHIVNSYAPETMEVLLQNEGQYPSRGEFISLKAYRELRKGWYNSKIGIVVMDGEPWRAFRSQLGRIFMSPESIKTYLPIVQDVTRDFVHLVRSRINEKMEVPDLLQDLYKWALESVAVIGLDVRLGCLDPNAPSEGDGKNMIRSLQVQLECINDLEATIGNFPYWKYVPSSKWKKFVRASDEFAKISFKYIDRSLNQMHMKTDGSAEFTILQSMLDSGVDLMGAGVMAADMLMAGIDTTSNAAAFLFYHLAKNPEKQEILYQEFMKILPRKEDRITVATYNEIPYFKACLKESMRLNPVVRGIMRILNNDVALCGYRIPGGTGILCVQQVMYRDEKYFANPNQFIPERWMGENKIRCSFFTPFGVGRRSCLGRRLAEVEIACVTAELIRNFKMEYHYEDMDMISRLVNVPSVPLRLKLLDR